MALLKFLKGNYSSLNSKAIAEGQILICGDTGEMFVDVAADKRVKIGDFVVIDTIENLEKLDATTVPTSRLYYVENGNILARSNGTEWKQINKQPTADQIKTMISLADYETKADASAKLTEAKGYTDYEVAKVHGEVDALETYVGTFTASEGVDTVVKYIDAKTANIASDETVNAIEKRVTQAVKDIDAIEASIGTVEEGKTVIGLIAAAQSAAEAAQATADQKATLDEVKALDYATKTEAQGYANAKDKAIEAAQKAGDDAQADVDALAGKVGTVAEGETVVGMIAALEEEAGKKVASVTAADKSITVGGTTTAPTVAAKLSADADNALELVEDGLKVVIPAAPEYSIVKDENAGEYAAVYHLTKGGVNVGAAINIPKDMVVKSGKVENGNIVLVLNDEANTEITIPASSLIEYVTSGSAADDMVVISVSDDHKVTAEITDGAITLTKLHVDIQTAIGKAHSHENADVLAGIDADMVEAWNAAEKNAKDHADAEIKKLAEGAVAANTAAIATKADQEAFEAYKNANDAAVALKANAADVYAKTETYTQEEIDAAIEAAKIDAANKDAVVLAEAQKGIDANAEAIAANEEAIAKNAEDIATKANAADVYAKTETYTQEEVDAAIEAALIAANSWGEF